MRRAWYFERWRPSEMSAYVTEVTEDFEMLLVQAADAAKRHERFRVHFPDSATDEQVRQLARASVVESM
jgi:hypothetical protein